MAAGPRPENTSGYGAGTGSRPPIAASVGVTLAETAIVSTGTENEASLFFIGFWGAAAPDGAASAAKIGAWSLVVLSGTAPGAEYASTPRETLPPSGVSFEGSSVFERIASSAFGS